MNDSAGKDAAINGCETSKRNFADRLKTPDQRRVAQLMGRLREIAFAKELLDDLCRNNERWRQDGQAAQLRNHADSLIGNGNEKQGCEMLAQADRQYGPEAVCGYMGETLEAEQRDAAFAALITQQREECIARLRGELPERERQLDGDATALQDGCTAASEELSWVRGLAGAVGFEQAGALQSLTRVLEGWTMNPHGPVQGATLQGAIDALDLLIDRMNPGLVVQSTVKQETVVLWHGAEHSARNEALARTRTAFLEAGGNVARARKGMAAKGNPIPQSTFYEHLKALDSMDPGWRDGIQPHRHAGDMDGRRRVGRSKER